LFDPEAVPSPRPGAHFAVARRRRQGRPPRDPCHKLQPFQAAPWRWRARWHPCACRGDNDRNRRFGPHQPDHARHRRFVPWSASRALYSAPEVPGYSLSGHGRSATI